MKFKYYLRGCGLGILAASFVFIIAIHARGGIINDDKAMERASELGMVMPETQTEEETQVTEIPVKETTSPDTQKTTQAEDKKHLIENTQDTQKTVDTELNTDTQKVSTEEKNTESKNTEKDTEKSGNKDTKKDTAKDKNKDTKKDTKKDESKDTKEDTQTQDDGDEVSFTVKSGEVCRVIAENLQGKGLIKDAEEFRKYMKDHNYANYIRVGTFKLKKGMSYADLAKALTKR